MLDWFIIPLALQLTQAPDFFYEPEVSAAVSEVVSRHEELDPASFVAELEALAEAGDASAAGLLGETFFSGLFGVERDPVRGCDYFESAENPTAVALHNIASCYFLGEGREQDMVKARALYLQAAEAGWKMSYCAYGNMLVRGEGGLEDKAEGLRLCRMTAALGDRDAQTDYGTYLLTGNGTDRDPIAARFMLEQAAAQKQRNAAYLLAQIYRKGDGVEQDYAQSQEWYDRAYEWGRTDAAFDAGIMRFLRGYRQGEKSATAEIAPELLREAIGWLEIAAQRDPRADKRAEAAELIENLEKILEAVS